MTTDLTVLCAISCREAEKFCLCLWYFVSDWGIIYMQRVPAIRAGHSGDVKVSTGVVKEHKRAAVCPVCVLKDTLNTNAKNNNNNFAMAA